MLAPAGGVAFTLAPGVDDVTIDGFSVAAPAVGGVTTTGAADDFARIVIRNNRFDAAHRRGDCGAAACAPTGRSPATAAKTPMHPPFVALLGGENSTVNMTENFLRGDAEAADLSAIVLENSIDAIVQDNTITSFGGDAIRLVNGALRASVVQNDLANVGVGVHLLATSGEETNWLEQVYIEYNTMRRRDARCRARGSRRPASSRRRDRRSVHLRQYHHAGGRALGG